MIVQGTVWKYGDRIDTDGIYPGKYLVIFDPAEVAHHAMEAVDPGFIRKVSPGDIVVAGENFGCGSAREQAAVALKCAGIGAVVAESFARTFFRNAINVGLPVLEVPGITGLVSDGHCLRVDLATGEALNLATGRSLRADPLPAELQQILADGGAIAHVKHRLGRPNPQ